MTTLACVAAPALLAQDSSPENHAKHVVELLQQQKFQDVAKEFNAQVAAQLTAERLEQVWTTVQSQAGAFKAILDQRVQNIQGMTAVISGGQFENAVLNIVVAFDADGKIAGLQLTPRTAPGPPPSTDPGVPPPATRF